MVKNIISRSRDCLLAVVTLTLNFYIIVLLKTIDLHLEPFGTSFKNFELFAMYQKIREISTPLKN